MSEAFSEILEHDLDQESESAPLRRRVENDEEMDITPMIDITFLLLIYFIVASVPDKDTAIELPKATHGVAVSQLTATVFTVGAGGADVAPVYSADGRIESERLSDNLDERKTEISDLVSEAFRENKTDVVVKADKDVAYREVDRVVKAVSKVEGVRIHLAVLEER